MSTSEPLALWDLVLRFGFARLKLFERMFGMNLNEVKLNGFRLNLPLLILLLSSGGSSTSNWFLWLGALLFSRRTSRILRCGYRSFTKRRTRKLRPSAANVLLEDVLLRGKNTNRHLVQKMECVFKKRGKTHSLLLIFLFTSTRRISLAKSFTSIWVLMVSGISMSCSAKALDTGENYKIHTKKT